MSAPAGALRGVRPDAERGPQRGQHQGQEEGAAAAGDPGRRQPLRRDTGRGRGNISRKYFYGDAQVVDEIFDKFAANKMGIERLGQVVLMIHCGSRGFGHQVELQAKVGEDFRHGEGPY